MTVAPHIIIHDTAITSRSNHHRRLLQQKILVLLVVSIGCLTWCGRVEPQRFTTTPTSLSGVFASAVDNHHHSNNTVGRRQGEGTKFPDRRHDETDLQSKENALQAVKLEIDNNYRRHSRAEKKLRLALKLQQMANTMLNAHGKWKLVPPTAAGESLASSWFWIPNAKNASDTTMWSSSLPMLPSASTMTSATTTTTTAESSTNHAATATTYTFPKDLDVAIYGSSFARELFLEMERMHYNLSTREICPTSEWKPGEKLCHTSKEWANITASQPILQNGYCMPYPHLLSIGSRSQCTHKPCTNKSFKAWAINEGVNNDLCGPPGFRVLANNHTMDDRRNVAIGFKTFIHSPDTEALFLQRLAASKAAEMGRATRVDVAILEMGTPWGPRGTRQDAQSTLTNMTLKEEIAYYVHWVHEIAFPDTIIVWVATCGCTQGDSALSVSIQETYKLLQKQELAIVVDKRHLCRSKPSTLPAGHGCAGPLLNVLGRIMFQMLFEIQRGK